MFFNLRNLILFFLIFLLAVGAAFYFLFFSLDDRVVSEGVFIESEYDIRALSSRLRREGVIRSPFYFRVLSLVNRVDMMVLPGYYSLSEDMSFREIIHTFQNPEALYVDLPPGLNKEQKALLLGDRLNWSEQDINYFPQTFAGIQWLEYQTLIKEAFQEFFEWDDLMVESFMTMSSFYIGELDFMKPTYVSGRYLIPAGASRARVGAMLINRFNDERSDQFRNNPIAFFDQEVMFKVADFVKEEIELLPDLVPLPASDVVLEAENGRIYLKFSTIYWNQGRGPLELIADPGTRDITGDVERDVYQRIYRLDGGYRDQLVGTFLWHEPHLHYHFTDFALYELSAVNQCGDENYINQKATFCIRDTESVDLDLSGAPSEPVYAICGRERQGISRGWADAYYFTYTDQNFDVTDFSSGLYRLAIVINPADRIEEISLDNNSSEIILRLDMENVTVEVIDN